MLLFSYVFDGVVGRKGHMILRNDLATITNGCDVMHGHARFCFTGGFHSLVDMMAPHAFASKLRQESRMNVDDAAWKCLEEVIGHQWQEARQHDELHVVAAQQWQHLVSIGQLGFWDNNSGNAQSPGAYQSKRIGTIADNENHPGNIRLTEVPDELFTIGTVTRNEYSNMNHND